MTDAPHRVDRLWPEPIAGLELDAAFAELDLPPPPAGRPWVGLNMVTSIDGRATREGGAERIAGRADRRLMRLLRAGYDAVASGAGTLRAGDFYARVPDDVAARRTARGLPPQPVAVVFGGARAIPGDRRFFEGDQPRVVFVGADAATETHAALRARAEVVVAPGARPEPAWALAELAARGIRSLLLEGGPTTNARFLAADLIDELYWTIGAALIGNDGLPMVAPITGGSPWEAAPRRGRLVSVHRAADDLFVRYRFAAGGASAG